MVTDRRRRGNIKILPIIIAATRLHLPLLRRVEIRAPPRVGAAGDPTTVVERCIPGPFGGSRGTVENVTGARVELQCNASSLLLEPVLAGVVHAQGCPGGKRLRRVATGQRSSRGNSSSPSSPTGHSWLVDGGTCVRCRRRVPRRRHARVAAHAQGVRAATTPPMPGEAAADGRGTWRRCPETVHPAGHHRAVSTLHVQELQTNTGERICRGTMDLT